MKSKKDFDCVEMKWEIQREIAKEYEGISDEESYKMQMERIANNPLLKKFTLKKMEKEGTIYPDYVRT
jgi:hypothetical protein